MGASNGSPDEYSSVTKICDTRRSRGGHQTSEAYDSKALRTSRQSSTYRVQDLCVSHRQQKLWSRVQLIVLSLRHRLEMQASGTAKRFTLLTAFTNIEDNYVKPDTASRCKRYASHREPHHGIVTAQLGDDITHGRD